MSAQGSAMCRVKELGNVTGTTADVITSGAVASYNAFADVAAIGQYVTYELVNASGNETWRGKRNGAGNGLTRDTLVRSSFNGTPFNTPYNWPSLSPVTVVGLLDCNDYLAVDYHTGLLSRNMPGYTLAGPVTATGYTMTGGYYVGLQGLALRSTGAAFDLTHATAEVLTAGRTVTWNVGDAARAITLHGDFTTAGAFTTVGAYGATLTFTNTTNATLPAGTVTLTSRSDNLSAFSATTSAQLAAVLSDETGTGLAVFNNAPALIAPTENGDRLQTLFNTPLGLNAFTSAPQKTTQDSSPTAGGTVTVRAQSLDHSVKLTPSGTLATLTVVFDATQLDGCRVWLTSTQIITALTLSGGTFDGTALSAMIANQTAMFQYHSSDGKWMRKI